MNYHYTLHDDVTNMTALVYDTTMKTKQGGSFAVGLRDDDSGRMNTSVHGFLTLERAIEKAKSLVPHV